MTISEFPTAMGSLTPRNEGMRRFQKRIESSTLAVQATVYRDAPFMNARSGYSPDRASTSLESGNHVDRRNYNIPPLSGGSVCVSFWSVGGISLAYLVVFVGVSGRRYCQRHSPRRTGESWLARQTPTFQRAVRRP